MAKHAERQKRALEADKPKEWFELKVNTSVYVTALPDDVTEAEFAEVMPSCPRPSKCRQAGVRCMLAA